MSDFNTGNTVPSQDPRDLDDNATVFDRLVNQHVASVLDRTGALRKTYWQMEQDVAALASPNSAALAGLTGSAGRFPYFTGAGAMTLAPSGSVGRDVLAAATQAEGRAALGISAPVATYGPSNILGTVSQTGGVPTGAIMQRTVGTNGECIRYADGTQICTWNGSGSQVMTTAAGALYRSGDIVDSTKAFALPFIAKPRVIPSHFQDNWYGFLAKFTDQTATNWPSIRALSVTSVTANVTWDMVAIGRWFA